MRVFLLQKSNKDIEAILSRYCFKIAPKVFVSFSISQRIEDFIFQHCRDLEIESKGMIMIKQCGRCQAITRSLGEVASACEIDGTIVFRRM